jgi:hypothetical protein
MACPRQIDTHPFAPADRGDPLVPDQKSDGLTGDHSAGGSVLTRERTGAIRFLDAASARALVRAAARPVRLVDGQAEYDPLDPASKTCCGHLCLEPSADPLRQDDADTVGHYAVHLYLDGLELLPVSVARELARHRGHVYLDRLPSITDSAAAALGAHRGGGLSLNNLRSLSPPAAVALAGHGG